MTITGIKLFTIYLLRDIYHAASLSSIGCSNINLWLLLFLPVIYLVVLKRPNITGFLLSRVCSRNTSSVKFKCKLNSSRLLFSAPRRETSLFVGSVILFYLYMLFNFMQILKANFKNNVIRKSTVEIVNSICIELHIHWKQNSNNHSFLMNTNTIFDSNMCYYESVCFLRRF